ncbi:response regulator [Pseudonocardia sichuanensis]
MSARILIAEDDRKQADVVRRFLDRDGYATAVVHDGVSAVDEARRRPPDLVVLDLMLPALDGLGVCRVLRAAQDVPIIMVTARATEDDVLLGLALGADDYVVKPFSPRELVARVRTVLRRAARAGGDEEYRVGDLLIDTARHEVRVRGARVPVTPAEFAVLACLAAAPGRVFTRSTLLEQASGAGSDATARTIDMHVVNLRRKVEQDPRKPRHLLTVYGVGYKLAEPADLQEVGGAP